MHIYAHYVRAMISDPISTYLRTPTTLTMSIMTNNSNNIINNYLLTTLLLVTVCY